MNEYTEIVLSGRAAALRLSPALRLKMMRALVEQLDEVALRWRQGVVTDAEMRVFVADIARAFRRYMGTAQGEIRATAIDAIREAIEAHRDALRGLGVSSFAGVPTDAVEAAFLRRSVLTFKTLARRRAQGFAALIHQSLDRMIVQGISHNDAARSIMRSLAAGDPYLRRVADQYGSRGGLTRAAREAGVPFDPEASQVARSLGFDARRLAITEANNAFHEGDRLAAMRSPVVGGMKWNLSPQHPRPDVCDILANHDAYGMGAGVYPPEYVPIVPHPFCVLPGARVQGLFDTAMRNYFSGDCREIVTAGGKRLAVTSNHPIVTSRGKIPAKGINVGDNVVCYRPDADRGGAPSVGFDEYKPPARVEDVFSAFLERGTRFLVERSPQYLHGEARFGKFHIDVVSADSELLLHGEASRYQRLGYLAFVLAHLELARVKGMRPLNLGGAAVPLPSPPLMGRLDPSAHLFRALDSGAGHSKAYGFGMGADLDALLTEAFGDEPSADAGRQGQLLDGLSSDVFFDEVVDVNDFVWSGHVYDFSTGSGYMIANGIAISNCKCYRTSVLRPASEWGKPKTSGSPVADESVARFVTGVTAGAQTRAVDQYLSNLFSSYGARSQAA